MSEYSDASIAGIEGTAAARELIEQHLQRLLASDAFDASERNRRFLRFIVDETISGRADRLKGYTIALSVFDRDSSFDPQLDPVVRIEAGRLRRSLERYYLTEGWRSEIKISVPKGHYIPLFEHRPAPEVCQPIIAYESPTLAGTSRVSVFPLDILSNTKAEEAVASILMDEIIVGLSTIFAVSFAHDGLSSLLQTRSDAHSGKFIDDYIFKSSVHFFADFIRYIGYLIDRDSGDVLWNKCIDIETRNIELTSVPERISGPVIEGILSARAPSGGQAFIQG